MVQAYLIFVLLHRDIPQAKEKCQVFGLLPTNVQDLMMGDHAQPHPGSIVTTQNMKRYGIYLRSPNQSTNLEVTLQVTNMHSTEKYNTQIG